MKLYPTSKQSAYIDRYTQDVIGIPGIVLMEKAADAAVRAFIEKFPSFDRKDKILVVAESGNNGGDGAATARILKLLGYDVDILFVKGLKKSTDSFDLQMSVAKKCGVGILEMTDEVVKDILSSDRYKIVFDAIFGVGLRREVAGKQKQAVDMINSLSAYKIAIDIPTGISADTGKVLGCAVKCDMTVTFSFIKYGMTLNDAGSFCGEILCPQIDLIAPPDKEFTDAFRDSEDPLDRELHYM